MVAMLRGHCVHLTTVELPFQNPRSATALELNFGGACYVAEGSLEEGWTGEVKLGGGANAEERHITGHYNSNFDAKWRLKSIL